MARNAVKTEQSRCSAIICRNCTAFKMHFRLIVVLISLISARPCREADLTSFRRRERVITNLSSLSELG